MSDLSLTYLPVTALKPRHRNPRTHSKKQIRKIAGSIKQFGFINPVLIDDDGYVIAGHGRLEAAKLLDLEHVPAIRLSTLTPAQLRAYVLADNKLAELAGWDQTLLKIEFQELAALDLNFDLTITGFETAEIDLLIGDPPSATDGKADAIPDLGQQAVVSRAGDVWVMGKHRLLCGDATDPAAFTLLMKGASAQLVLCDPPYNMPIAGHVTGLGRARHDEFAMASGEMSPAHFQAFLAKICAHLTQNSIDGSLHYLFMDWRHLYDLLAVGRAAYAELKNLCVWNKTNGGMGSFYRSKHELVCVFKNGTAPHINNIELGRHGRDRTNVWDYPGVNSFGQDRDSALAMHPTVKPVNLVSDAILDASRRGGVVLDAFLGSGTTLIAAEKTGRRCYGMEISPKYTDVAVLRWQEFTGAKAMLESSDKSFDVTRAGRAQGEE